MKKIKIFIFAIFFSILNYTHTFAVIENKIIANVNNQVISTYELKDKIKTILFLSNQSLSQKNINFAKMRAMKSLIDHKLKLEEINRYKISIEESVDISKYLENIASKYNTNKEGLRNIFNNNQIDFENYTHGIRVDFAWNNLIFSKYKEKVNLNEKEVEDELNKIIKNKKEVEEYKLSEIEILIDNIADNEKKIKEIYEQIELNGFNDTAVKFSVSSTSLEGGNLDWVNSKSLSNNVYNSVKILKIGEVTKPIIKTGNIIFLKLNDRRTSSINNSNIINIRNQIINKKKNEMLSLYSNNYLSKLKNKALIEIKYE
jgi:peptidyl-prolyl cis-trans isomerase SurA